MKKVAFLAVATIFAAGAALADDGVKTNNGNDQNKNCFGQARAAAARAGVVGENASARKGENSTINAEFKEACQQPS